MAAGDFLSSIEFISPIEFAKRKIQSVQEYSLLSAQTVANLFRRPIYGADMMQQADTIGMFQVESRAQMSCRPADEAEGAPYVSNPMVR